ncbi:MAG: cell division protein SepF [Propionibacterium sp.]|nr:cell division protein SepF [Propionibacterium sp.]
MGFWRGAAEWLGLVNEDRYGDYDEADQELTEAVDDYDEHTEASVTDIESRRPVNPTPRVADLTRIITVHPRTYNEARTIGEHFRDSVPVIMNLTEMDDADAKRLVDFAAGLIFGLRGTIERVTGKVFLLSPQNVNVTAEDKERIAGGFYNQS